MWSGERRRESKDVPLAPSWHHFCLSTPLSRCSLLQTSSVKFQRASFPSLSTECVQCTTRGPPSFSKLKCWPLARMSLHAKASEEGKMADKASKRWDVRGGYMMVVLCTVFAAVPCKRGSRRWCRVQRVRRTERSDASCLPG